MVSIAILMLHVILVAFRRAIHLFEKTCIFRVTVRVVRAAQSHGRLELEVAWIGGGKQMLLLLQHGEQHFLTDVARLSRLVDDRRGAFVRLSLICFAVFVGGLRFGAKRHGFQAFLAAACGTLFFDDGVHLLLAQRVPVEEQTI